MRAIQLIVPFFACSSLAFCQLPQNRNIYYSCPAGFSVQIDGRAVAHSASDLKRPVGAVLNFQFAPDRSAKLLAASITVHGTPVTDRYQKIEQQAVNDDATRQHLTLLAPQGEALISSGVSVNFPMVSSVELNELRYDDGYVWHSTASAVCSVTPSKLRLIDAVAH
jgi:hypothetical protein